MNSKKPNVLFLMTDQQRWDCLGCNGNEILKTPNLDSIANDGVNFTKSFTAAIACVPSRACIMSGQYSHVNGVQTTSGGNWLKPETPTLPGVFSLNGYHSAGVGKMHFSPWTNLSGFDERVIIESKYMEEDDEYRLYLKEKGAFHKRIGHHTQNFGKEYKSIPSTELHPDDHIDGYIGKKGVEKLAELLGKEKPFFLMLSFCGPHDPFDPPAEFAKLYSPGKMQMGPFRDGELDILPPECLRMITCMGKEKLDLTKIPDAKKREIIAHYYANITLIDEWVGKVINLLKESGEYDNTVIVFSSDHGEYLTDHNILFKGSFPCDSDCAVPFFVKPHNAAGKCPARCDRLVDNTSIMPTLLDLAGLKVPESCQGKSLKSAILGKEPEQEEEDFIVTYSEAGPAWRLRTRTHAFVYRHEKSRSQLYRLDKDPHELQNLIQFEPEKSAPLAARMREMLLEWFAKNGTPKYYPEKSS
ncbi:MAG: hypothetical protein A2X49_08795 [Lentisphaerae bacterium GWF2_52_8]|nr:MAG: hypothetical protein A2X49_08795 [Lentisphaerae bacterium GWF2_52_8]